jgi:hypothetical protein
MFKIKVLLKIKKNLYIIHLCNSKHMYLFVLYDNQVLKKDLLNLFCAL